MTKWAVVEDGPHGPCWYTEEDCLDPLKTLDDVCEFWRLLYGSQEEAVKVACDHQRWSDNRSDGDGIKFGIVAVELDEPKISDMMEVLP